MTQAIVVTYERVSSDKQDIDRQSAQRQRALADYPEAEHRVIQDDGVSAFKVSVFDRPGGTQVGSARPDGRGRGHLHGRPGPSFTRRG